jgi:hypothetical protein
MLYDFGCMSYLSIVLRPLECLSTLTSQFNDQHLSECKKEEVDVWDADFLMQFIQIYIVNRRELFNVSVYTSGHNFIHFAYATASTSALRRRIK